MDVNKVSLVGNLTADPRSFGEGKVIMFTIACNGGKDKNGEERVNYVPVKAFGKTAEYAPELAKGVRVFVDGYVTTEKYEKDGKATYSVAVVAWQILAIQKRAGTSNAPANNFGGQHDYGEVPF